VATDQFESNLERIVAALRTQLGAAFQQHAAEIAERTAAEREAAIRQAAEAARKESQEQVEHVRRTAQEQIDAARRSGQEQLEAARRSAQAEARPAPAPRRRWKTFAGSAAHRSRKSSGRWRSTVGDDAELDESRREAATRRQELDSARGASAASLTELVRGLHTVDEAESLTAVLERLLEGARPHSNRAAMLLVRDNDLREWAHAGFEGQPGVGERGISIASSAAGERRRVESESALAFPVTVGGEVVAVLYAEVGDALSPQRRICKDALDALTRHAGRMLETLTVQQARDCGPSVANRPREIVCREAGAGSFRAGHCLRSSDPCPGPPAFARNAAAKRL
jgi:hypothetical protein